MVESNTPRDQGVEPRRLADRTDPRKIVEGLIWASEFDGRYWIELQQAEGESFGSRLVIFDNQSDEKVIMNEEFTLDYEPRFGIDVADLRRLQARVEQYIDNELGPKL